MKPRQYAEVFLGSSEVTFAITADIHTDIDIALERQQRRPSILSGEVFFPVLETLRV